MNTLVTGGNGLVGSAIEADFKPSSRELDLMDYDAVLDYLTDNKIDSVVHCAAKVGGIKANLEEPADFYRNNILMNTNLLDAAYMAGIKR